MIGSFAIPPEQIDYSNFLTYEERGRFKTKLKDIVLSSFKLFSDNWKF